MCGVRGDVRGVWVWGDVRVVWYGATVVDV